MGMSPDEFAEKIKAKYPEYKDIPSGVLVPKILAKYPEYKSKLNLGPVPSEPEQSSLGRFGGRYLEDIKGMIPSAKDAAIMAIPGVGPTLALTKQFGSLASQIPGALKEFAPLTAMAGEQGQGAVPGMSRELYGQAAKTGQDVKSVAPESAADVAFGLTAEALFRGGPKVAEAAKPVVGKTLEMAGRAAKSPIGKGAGSLAGLAGGGSLGTGLGHPWIGASIGARIGSSTAGSIGEILENVGKRIGAKNPGDVSLHAGPIPGTETFKKVTQVAEQLEDKATPPKEAFVGKTSGAMTEQQMKNLVGYVFGEDPATVKLEDYPDSIKKLEDGTYTFMTIQGGENIRRGFEPRKEYGERAALLTQEVSPPNQKAPWFKKYASVQIPFMNWFTDETGVHINSAKDLYAQNPKLQSWLWDKYTHDVIGPDRSVTIDINHVPRDIATYIDPAYAHNAEVQPFLTELLDKYRRKTQYAAGKTTLGDLANRVRNINVSLRDSVVSKAEKVVLRAEMDSILPQLNDTLESLLKKRIAKGEKIPYGKDLGSQLRNAYGATKEVGKHLDAMYGYSLKQGVVGPSGEVTGAKSRVTNASIPQDEMIKEIYQHRKGSGGPKSKVPPTGVDLTPKAKASSASTKEPKPPKLVEGAAGEAGAVAKPRVIPQDYKLGTRNYTFSRDMSTNLKELERNYMEEVKKMVADASQRGVEPTPKEANALSKEYEKAEAKIRQGVKIETGNSLVDRSGTAGRESPLNEDITSEGGVEDIGYGRPTPARHEEF